MAPKPPKIPVSSIIAIVIILFFCTFLALSIANYPPGFTPLKNWMSDLGNPRLNPAGSTYFNGACVISGLLLAVFYLGLSHSRDNSKNRMLTAARALGVFSGLALVGVGVFNETFEPHHFIVSVLFFISSTLAILLSTIALQGQPGYSRASAWAGYLTVAVGIVFFIQMATLRSVTIIEWISVISMLLWAALAGIDMYRASRDHASAGNGNRTIKR